MEEEGSIDVLLDDVGFVGAVLVLFAGIEEMTKFLQIGGNCY